MLGFEQTWLGFSLSPGSGTNCSFQQGRACSGGFSAAAQPAQSAHWVRQTSQRVLAVLQWLPEPGQKKKEETNWWIKAFLFDVWAGAFALSHCPGFQANTQSPSVLQGCAHFHGGVFVLHYCLEELLSQPIDIPCFSKPELTLFVGHWEWCAVCQLNPKKSLKLKCAGLLQKRRTVCNETAKLCCFSRSRQVGVCSITVKDDLWEHSEEETEKHRVVLFAAELLTRTYTSWTSVYSILCIPSWFLSVLREQPSE